MDVDHGSQVKYALVKGVAVPGWGVGEPPSVVEVCRIQRRDDGL
jgi:hypothetical protein